MSAGTKARCVFSPTLFNVKIPSNCDKSAATAASALISLAAAIVCKLTAAYCS